MLSNQDIFDLISDGSEESRELIYKNYDSVMNIYMNKYKKLFNKHGIEYQDAKAECMYAFNEAINSYNLDKKASFKTFLSMCIERRLLKTLRSANTEKSKLNSGAYSLNYVYDESGLELVDLLEEPMQDPIYILENEEVQEDLQKKIKGNLSELEFKVYKLMLDNYDLEDISKLLEKDKKQIDNAMQRLKFKIKDIIDNKSEINQ